MRRSSQPSSKPPATLTSRDGDRWIWAALSPHRSERQPGEEAIVDGSRRRTYAQWYEEIKAVAGGLQAMGLTAGDHLVVVMRNRYEMATLYWACHLIGVIFTPVSWRATADEIQILPGGCAKPRPSPSTAPPVMRQAQAAAALED